MRVLICGAGIAGLTLAWRLEQIGHSAIVIERAPHLRDEGYMIDFFGAGYNAAEAAGLIPDLEAIHYPIDALTFVNGAGRERFSLRYHTLRQRLFKDRHFNFLRGDLERVLHARLTRASTIRFGETVEAIDPAPDAVRVRLSGGLEMEADLLVGADGIRSSMRRLAFGPDALFVRALGYEMAAFILDGTPDGVPADRFVTLTLPRRQVTVYPIRGGRTATFFLHEAKTNGDRSDAHRSAAETLRREYGDMNWIVPELLRQGQRAPSVLFDQVEQVRMTRWRAGRIVLLGDAAWCVSPLAGQGASMAIAGACVLADELAAGGTTDAALERYERRLRPAIERQQRAAMRIAKWFVPHDRFHRIVRDSAARLSVSRLAAPVLRRRMAATSTVPGN